MMDARPFKKEACLIFVKGATGFISRVSDPQVLNALSTPNGGKETYDN